MQHDRAEKLSIYLEDAYERSLSSMDEDVWIAYFESKKKEHEDRIAAENKAEEERIAREKAEAEERERIRKENEQLKKEAEKKEKEEALRKTKEDAEREAKEQEEARVQLELNKGDSDKVKDLKVDLIGLKSKYSFKSKKNQKMFSDVRLLIEKIINHING